jgi:threonyl-tRNA synthetase
MLIIGAKEAEAGNISVRTRAGEDLGAMDLDAFIEKVLEEIRTKAK